MGLDNYPWKVYLRTFLLFILLFFIYLLSLGFWFCFVLFLEFYFTKPEIIGSNLIQLRLTENEFYRVEGNGKSSIRKTNKIFSTFLTSKILIMRNAIITTKKINISAINHGIKGFYWK